jgi:hypothetical protein
MKLCLEVGKGVDSRRSKLVGICLSVLRGQYNSRYVSLHREFWNSTEYNPTNYSVSGSCNRQYNIFRCEAVCCTPCGYLCLVM